MGLAAALSALALPLLTPALSHAEEAEGGANPNNYECNGHISAGKHEAGNSSQEVAYQFACDGPILGYQIQSQLPLSGFSSAPLVTTGTGEPLTDTFSCSGEFPGYAVNCVGAAKAPGEIITGQFSIESKLCTEPRVDPLLTVTYAYIEKEAITQAISGPFDLGRPHGCNGNPNGVKPRLEQDPVAEAKADAEKEAKQGKLLSAAKHGSKSKAKRPRKKAAPKKSKAGKKAAAKRRSVRSPSKG